MKKISLTILLLLALTVGSYTIYGLFKPLPEGLSYEGNVHSVSNVEFIADIFISENCLIRI